MNTKKKWNGEDWSTIIWDVLPFFGADYLWRAKVYGIRRDWIEIDKKGSYMTVITVDYHNTYAMTIRTITITL